MHPDNFSGGERTALQRKEYDAPCIETRKTQHQSIRWSMKRGVELPEDVLDVIYAYYIKRSELRDIIRTSSMCKRWYSLAMSKICCRTPWLMLQENSRLVRFVSLWSGHVSEGRYLRNIYPNNIPNPTSTSRPIFGWTCLTSSTGGWLLFGCHCRDTTIPGTSLCGSNHPLALYNPFSNVSIKLPPHLPPPFPHGREYVQCFVFSSEHLSCDFVALIVKGYNRVYLFKLDSGQRSWLNYSNSRGKEYLHILFWKEEQLLCAIDKSLVVDVFMLVECGASSEVGLRLIKSEQLRLENMDRYTSSYLVESGGDVLIVVVHSSDKLVVQVYKLSLSEGLRKIACLGGYALFLGIGCPTFSVAPKDWNSRVKEDCIYLATLSHVSVFSLKDGVTTKTFYDHSFGLSSFKTRMAKFIQPLPADYKH